MNYKREIFKNGLQLVMINGLSTKAVTIEAVVHAGFRFDPEGKCGLSHFVEHMVFAGTKSYSTLQDEARAVEQYGGYHIAYTWIEEQKHTVHIPSDYFKEGFDVLFESLFSPSIKKSEVKKEKGVIKEENLRERSDPKIAVWDKVWFPLFFQDTNLGKSYLGDIKDIENTYDNDIKNYLKKYFTLDNMVLLVAGNFDEDLVRNTIIERTKNLPKLMKKNAISTLKPNRNKKVLVYGDKSCKQSSIMVGVQTVPFSSKDRYALNILKNMLGGYFGAKLIYKLRDEGGLIYTWNIFHEVLSDIGFIVFTTSAVAKNVHKVTKIIIDEFKRISEGKFFDGEVKTAKGNLIGSILSSVETGKDYIAWYGMQELLDPNNIMHIEDEIEICKNLTTEELKRVASKYFNPDNILVGILGEGSEEKILKTF